MPKLPVPVPPADDINEHEHEPLFVIPAQRRGAARRAELAPGISPAWLGAGDHGAERVADRRLT